MKNLPIALMGVGALILCLAGQAMAVGIVVSPSTVNLQSQGEYVTVHVDIDYDLVAAATVTLNGIEIAFSKVDNLGDFVAKFNVDDVKAILEPGMAVLTLAGETKDGVPFSGTDTIRVVSVKGTGN